MAVGCKTCTGKDIIKIRYDNNQIPIMVKITGYNRDLTNPGAGYQFLITVHTEGPDGIERTDDNNTGTVQVVNRNHISFEYPGNCFSTTSLGQYCIWITIRYETTGGSEVDTYQIKTDSCIITYDDCNCPK